MWWHCDVNISSISLVRRMHRWCIVKRFLLFFQINRRRSRNTSDEWIKLLVLLSFFDFKWHAFHMIYLSLTPSTRDINATSTTTSSLVNKSFSGGETAATKTWLFQLSRPTMAVLCRIYWSCREESLIEIMSTNENRTSKYQFTYPFWFAYILSIFLNRSE